MCDLANCGEDIEFRALDLLDKFGFGDGDMLEDLVWEWALREWPSSLFTPDDIVDYNSVDHPSWSYIHDRRLLVRVLVERLLPALPPAASRGVVCVGGVHNPLRLCAPEGVNEGAWLRDAEHQLGDVCIAVPVCEVFALCSSVFPQRSPAWLELYDALAWQFALAPSLPEPHRLELPRDRVMGLVNDLHARLGEEGSRLFVGLLGSRCALHGSDPRVTPDLVEELARVSELCCAPCG